MKIVIILILILGIGSWFYFNNNSIKNTNMNTVNQTTNTQSNTNDEAAQIELVKNVYDAFKNKDIETLRTLSKTRNQNMALALNESFDSFEESVMKDFTLTMNDTDTNLLPLDYSSLKFEPVDGGASFLVVAERTESPFSYKNPITYYQEEVDLAQEYELYIAKVDGVWKWVK